MLERYAIIEYLEVIESVGHGQTLEPRTARERPPNVYATPSGMTTSVSPTQSSKALYIATIPISVGMTEFLQPVITV